MRRWGLSLFSNDLSSTHNVNPLLQVGCSIDCCTHLTTLQVVDDGVGLRLVNREGSLCSYAGAYRLALVELDRFLVT